MRKERQNSSSSDSGATPGTQTFTKNHYRLVVMGAASVGKTCIVSRFLYEKFLSEYKATVEEFHQRLYEVNGMELTVDVLDTSGSYEFPAMRKLSITTGDAFILVYSVNDESSFDEVQSLREQILGLKGNVLVPIVIVGNKTDLATTATRAIQRETAETTANIDWDNGYVEVSAKDNINIDRIFRELLVQARIQLHDNSPARIRRRDSMPIFASSQRKEKLKLAKRNSCTIS